jgi:hypothetical protein
MSSTLLSRPKHTSTRLRLGLGARLLCAATLGGLLLACQGDSLKPDAPAKPNELYWDLELNHHAVTLSKTAEHYDTLTLVAVPRNYHGDHLAELPAPQYISRNLERVSVTSNGLLSAVAPTAQPVWVVATLTVGNLKHQDSVFVQVVDNPVPPVFASFSVHPIPPDSAKVAVDWLEDPTLPVRAFDPNSAPISGLVAAFRVSDPKIARVHPTNGQVRGLAPGSVTIYASATAFGVTRADTLTYRIGWPLLGEVGIWGPVNERPLGSFNRPELRVGTGAIVFWTIDRANKEMTTDVTFADADLSKVGPVPDMFFIFCLPFFGYDTDCGTENFALGPPPMKDQAIRGFPVPGTYEYRSTLHGTSARIVVVDER